MPMGSDTTKQPPNILSGANVAVQLHPELLMAAQLGEWDKLDDLLNKEYAPAVILVPEEVVVDIEEADTAVTIEEADTAVTIEEDDAVVDSTLHVVASSGDGDEFLKSATVIYSKAKHLMDTRNRNGDTPLHCAARAGRIKMVSHLISLARGEDDGGDARVQVLLRKQNDQGETALHQAIRLSNKKTAKKVVDVLMSADAELARFPPSNGTSPLYLAVSLGHDDIAELLYEKDRKLSYSGPDGQNVLHVAVLRGKEMTAKLLQWNKDLTKQRDRSMGSTPLHYAASWGDHEVVKLLIEEDKFSAFQADNKGSFPIHVAALENQVNAVLALLEKLPHCAELRDAQGWTFLHITVDKLNYCSLFRYARNVQEFGSIMNMQDNDGNTGLHLAAKLGNLWIFYCLMWSVEVQLNLPNNKRQTALDVSWSNKPTGLLFPLDPRIRIFNLLKVAGAKFGSQRRDRFREENIRRDYNEEAKKISGITKIVGIVSVLMATMAFTAAFTLPGGYRADGGTPVLARRYAFDAFILGDMIALLCSCIATISLLYTGVTVFNIRVRMSLAVNAVFFLSSSFKSLGAAFAFGLFVMLDPVAHTTAVVSVLITMFVTLFDSFWFIFLLAAGEFAMRNRLGIRTLRRMAWYIVVVSSMTLWPYLVIGAFLAYLKICGVH